MYGGLDEESRALAWASQTFCDSVGTCWINSVPISCSPRAPYALSEGMVLRWPLTTTRVPQCPLIGFALATP